MELSKKTSFALIFLSAVSLGIAVACLMMTGDPSASREERQTWTSVKKIQRKTSSKAKMKSKRLPISAERLAQISGKLRTRPTMDIGDEDEAKLTVLQKELLNEIRKAMEEEDRARVMRLIQRLQKSPEWPDGVPNAIKKAAIDALGWFGGDCLPEIAGFLMDADEEILTEAAEIMENRLMDANGDAEISEIIIAASKMINDAEAMESILMELSNMRNSRIVSTIKEVWKSGTPAAKKALPDAIEFATGEENLSTPEQLDAWYNDPSGDNLDGEDAEDLYGPIEDE